MIVVIVIPEIVGIAHETKVEGGIQWRAITNIWKHISNCDNSNNYNYNMNSNNQNKNKNKSSHQDMNSNGEKREEQP